MTEFTHEPVKKALEKLIQLSADEEVRRLAEVRERALHDWNLSINSAQREGLEQGLEQGRIQALAKRSPNKRPKVIAGVTSMPLV